MIEATLYKKKATLRRCCFRISQPRRVDLTVVSNRGVRSEEYSRRSENTLDRKEDVAIAAVAFARLSCAAFPWAKSSPSLIVFMTHENRKAVCIEDGREARACAYAVSLSAATDSPHCRAILALAVIEGMGSIATLESLVRSDQ